MDTHLGNDGSPRGGKMDVADEKRFKNASFDFADLERNSMACRLEEDSLPDGEPEQVRL